MSRICCALYLRVSTRDARQHTDSQRIQLRDFALTQDWEVVEVFEDQESGANADRPGFRAMIRAAGQRRFDVLLFWSLDRLTREGALKTLQYLNTLSG